MIMGNYIDRHILSLRKLYQKNAGELDFPHDKYLIRGMLVSFLPVMLFDEKVMVFLPENFIEMPEEIAQVRYISTDRPNVIWTSTNYSENFGYHLLEDEELDIGAAIEQMKEAVLNDARETVIYDSNKFTPKQADSNGEIRGSWFEYKNFTVNDETYNIQFLFQSGRTILAGTFNCPMQYYDEWKAPVLASLEHITMNQKGCETDESRNN